jgi:hypothetical protein
MSSGTVGTTSGGGVIENHVYWRIVRRLVIEIACLYLILYAFWSYSTGYAGAYQSAGYRLSTIEFLLMSTAIIAAIFLWAIPAFLFRVSTRAPRWIEIRGDEFNVHLKHYFLPVEGSTEARTIPFKQLMSLEVGKCPNYCVAFVRTYIRPQGKGAGNPRREHGVESVETRLYFNPRVAKALDEAWKDWKHRTEAT